MALTKVKSGGITDATIATADIANDAVTSAKIADGTIVGADIASSAIDTAKIADTAVTLAKLEHGTSSNDGKFLRANNGADPTFETVTGTTINNNGNKKVIIGTSTANTLEADSNLFVANGKLSIGNVVPSGQISNNSLDVKGDETNAYIDLGDPFPTFSSGQFPTARLKTVDANRTLELQSMYGGDNQLYKHIELSGHNTIFYEGNNNNTEIARITTDGLTFNGDTAAANALDDYEEGTWTPSPENLSNTPTYYNQAGKYVKIGSFVTIWGFIQIGNTIPTFSNDTMHLHIAGLPFAANDTTGYVSGVGVTTHQNFYWRGSTYNDYGANGPCFCGVANSTRTMFQVLADVNNGIRGTLRRKALSASAPILTWTISYRTTA